MLYVNQAVLDYMGITLRRCAARGLSRAFFHPDDLARLREQRRKALTGVEPFEDERRVLGKDSRYRWFLVRYSPLLDEQGRVDRWYAAAFDIEDRKRAEAQVEQAYLRLAEAQRLSKTGSFVTDLLADEHHWSDEAFRIFEFDPATRITVQMVRDMVHPGRPAVVRRRDRARHDRARISTSSSGSVTARGAVKYRARHARVMEQIAGRPLFIGALQDVTESRQAEQALNKARSELFHVSRVMALSALTASIAHEVNQPLAGIITNASTCLRMLSGRSTQPRRRPRNDSAHAS